ncbi:MAG: hypothetical protein AB7T27_12465 [Kiritimatiellia bacterium]
MARNYNVKGTNTYLVASIVLIVLAAWFIWDGWFPSAGVLAKHPDPTDTFYAFNKTTGVLMAISAFVCAIIHIKVR